MESKSLSAVTVTVIDPVDEDNGYQPYYERPETYIVPVVFFIIFVVGVLGNGTLVIIFLKHRAMRNVPNTYIFSLALADLFVIVCVVPFISIIYTIESFPWGEFICKITEAIKDVSIGVSVFTLTALSAERYCAIVNPLKKFQTKSLTVLSATLIWIVATALSLPDAIFSTVEMANDVYYCTPYPQVKGDFYKIYSVVAKAIIYYILPLIIISIFYILMAKRLHESTREMPGESQGKSQVQANARKHVASMVLAFVFLFFICFFPYHLFMLWFILNPNAKNDYNERWHALKIIGFCMAFLNSCVNPVALYCVSGVFRQHYNHYLCCRSYRRFQRNAPMGETSFNSTYRKHTQMTTIDQQGSHRKHKSILMQTEENDVIATVIPLKSHEQDPMENLSNKTDNIKNIVGHEQFNYNI